MKRQITRSIVLSRVNFGEADRIVTVLTESYGKVSVIAKGSRKIKSKLAGGIEPFSLSEIVFVPGKRDIGTLISSEMKQNFEKLTSDYQRTTVAYEFIKWVNDHLEQGTGEEYFETLLNSLKLLNNSKLPLELAHNYFFVQALRLYGMSINSSHGSDGKQLQPSANYKYDFENSVFVVGDGIYTVEHIKALRVVSSSDLDLIVRINIPVQIHKELQQIIKNHVSFYAAS